MFKSVFVILENRQIYLYHNTFYVYASYHFVKSKKQNLHKLTMYNDHYK